MNHFKLTVASNNLW